MRLYIFIEEEDFINFRLFIADENKISRNTMNIIRIISILVIAIVPFIIMETSTTFTFISSIIMILIIEIIAIKNFNKIFTKNIDKKIVKDTRKMLASEKAEEFVGRRTLEIKDQGIKIITKNKEETVLFKDIEKVAVDSKNNNIYFFINDRDDFIIPFNTFHDIEKQREFLLFLEREVKIKNSSTEIKD